MTQTLITGASGLVGRRLADRRRSAGCRVRALVRRAARDDSEITWDPATGRLEAAALEGVDEVVHLAGEPIAEGRWTASKKKAIRESRVNSTRLLAEALARMTRKPRVFVSASAIGFYGDRGEELLTEASAAGDGFLAGVAREWEAATQPAAEAGIRVVNARFGVILATGGGALAKLLKPFRMGVGGPVGKARQYMSWVSIDDVIRALEFCLDRPTLSGPVNVVAPEPVTNRAFTEALGKAIHRPAVVPVPEMAISLMFGEMGRETILASARVIPQRLQDAGFEFEHPTLDAALQAVLKDDHASSSSNGGAQ
jgi:uncharacterized protein (TIGR01777 family)